MLSISFNGPVNIAGSLTALMICAKLTHMWSETVGVMHLESRIRDLSIVIGSAYLPVLWLTGEVTDHLA